jgi:hypothetical protein
MSGIMLNVIGRSYIVPPPTIGTAYQGGYMGGQISTTQNGVATHNIVVSPLATGGGTMQWKTSNTVSTNPDGYDGYANSVALYTAGHTAAIFCRDLTIGGYTDWYLPSMQEIEILYWNLKPTTAGHNSTIWPYNNIAVPNRVSLSTYDTHPGQTTAALFQSGGAQAFAADNHWTSNNWGDTWGRYTSFSDGFAWGATKTTSNPVRAIRKVVVGTI